MTFKEMYNLLEEKFTSLETEEQWRDFLQFSNKFKKYSFFNQLLIYLEKPFATYVAGFKVWQKEFKRYVKRGEKAIYIFAPLIKKTKDKNDVENSFLMGFKSVCVFDVSQTEGEPMPSISDFGMPTKITNILDSNLLLSKLLTNAGKYVPVNFTRDEGCPSGTYNTKTNLIRIRSDLGFDGKCSTLLHEFAHFLHNTRYKEILPNPTVEQKEFIAESSAYIVGDTLNLNMLTKSAQYLKAWNKDGKLFHSLSVIIEKISKDMTEIFLPEQLATKMTTDLNEIRTKPADPFFQNELGKTA